MKKYAILLLHKAILYLLLPAAACISVQDALAVTQDSLCVGNSIQICGAGLSPYTWSIVPGGDSLSISCDTCLCTTVDPAITTEYILTDAILNQDTVKVTVLPGFSSSATGDTSLCEGSITTICASADSTYSSYSYQWAPDSSLFTPNNSCSGALPLVSTTYVVTITAFSACSNYDSVTVSVFPVPAITVSSPDDSICGSDSTQLFCTLIPGATYIWFPTTGLSNANIANPIAFPDSNITYYVTVTDSVFPFCSKSEPLSIAVGIDFNISISISSSTVCQTEGSQLEVLTDTGGIYIYTWTSTPLGYLSDPSIWNPVATLDEPSTFYVTVDNGYCSKQDSVSLNLKGYLPDITVTATETMIDSGQSTALSANLANFLNDTVYKWSPALSLDDSTIANPTASPLLTTRYFVTVSDNGCNDTGSVLITVGDTGTGFGSVSSGSFGLITVYPVPASGKIRLTFDSNKAGNIEIELVNLLGKSVLRKQLPAKKKANSYDLDISALKPGIYLLRVLGKDHKVVKIVRQ